MAKYAKYLIIVLAVAIISVVLIWYVFIKPNDEVTKYMEKFEQNIPIAQQDVQKNQPDNEVIGTNEIIPNNETNIDNKENENDNKENNAQEYNNNNKEDKDNKEETPNVILASETEMLNKQGEELLKQISEELENSILTIKQSTGVVDNDMLNNDTEI